MRSRQLLFWMLMLLVSGGLGFVYSTYVDLENENETLRKKIAELEFQGSKPARMSIVTVAPRSRSAVRDEVYRNLKTLNDVHSPLDSTKQKRVQLFETLLTVRDPKAANEDAFYDLLGILMDEDLVEKVEIPDPAPTDSTRRTYFRNIRQELIRFGIPAETLVIGHEPELRILLRKPF